MAAGFAMMLVSGLVWSSFGLFLVAMAADLAWSRTQISGAFTIFALTNALSAPIFGTLMLRHDSRHLLAGTAALLGCALVGAAQVERVWQYWLVFGVLGGVGAQSVSSFALFSIFARRFRRRLATAMSVADAGSGFAGMAGLVLIQQAIEAWGWRGAYAGLGIAVAVAGVALHLLVLDGVRRRGDRPASGLPQGAAARGMIRHVRAALVASAFCGSAAYHALLTQQIALLVGEGVAVDRAVWTASAASAAVFLWRLGSGWLSDSWGVVRVMALAGVAVVVALLSLGAVFMAPTAAVLGLYATALGIGYGGQQVIVAVTLRRAGSPAHYPVLLGWVRFASGLGMAFGPIAASALHDASGDSRTTVVFVAVMSVVYLASYFAAILVAKHGTPAHPARQ